MTEYQRCECPRPTGNCCGGFGPAAMTVTRNGQELRLCTRCDLPGDSDKRLLITEVTDELFNFDPVGALCLQFKLDAASR